MNSASLLSSSICSVDAMYSVLTFNTVIFFVNLHHNILIGFALIGCITIDEEIGEIDCNYDSKNANEYPIGNPC